MCFNNQSCESTSINHEQHPVAGAKPDDIDRKVMDPRPILVNETLDVGRGDCEERDYV